MLLTIIGKLVGTALDLLPLPLSLVYPKRTQEPGKELLFFVGTRWVPKQKKGYGDYRNPLKFLVEVDRIELTAS